MPEVDEKSIQVRAHQQEAGKPEGRDKEFWQEAERQLKGNLRKSKYETSYGHRTTCDCRRGRRAAATSQSDACRRGSLAQSCSNSDNLLTDQDPMVGKPAFVGPVAQA